MCGKGKKKDGDISINFFPKFFSASTYFKEIFESFRGECNMHTRVQNCGNLSFRPLPLLV